MAEHHRIQKNNCFSQMAKYYFFAKNVLSHKVHFDLDVSLVFKEKYLWVYASALRISIGS